MVLLYGLHFCECLVKTLPKKGYKQKNKSVQVHISKEICRNLFLKKYSAHQRFRFITVITSLKSRNRCLGFILIYRIKKEHI